MQVYVSRVPRKYFIPREFRDYRTFKNRCATRLIYICASALAMYRRTAARLKPRLSTHMTSHHKMSPHENGIRIFFAINRYLHINTWPVRMQAHENKTYHMLVELSMINHYVCVCVCYEFKLQKIRYCLFLTTMCEPKISYKNPWRTCNLMAEQCPIRHTLLAVEIAERF
jgi:hypothetical protein